MKIYVAAVEALRERERRWNSVYHQNLMVFWALPYWMLIYFFVVFFLSITPIYDQTQGCGAVFSFTFGDNSIVLLHNHK
jgi:hypothetical protein